MLGMTTRTVRRKMDDVVLLIDSTGLHLAGIGTQWARFSAKACGAKAHIVYDPDRPAGLSRGHAGPRHRPHGRQAMPIEAGATYVFDLGYYDYGWWGGLHGPAAGSSRGSRPTRP